MKQIIDSKLYNTETAELVADNEFQNGSNRLNTGSASHLFKTKKGAFFLFHETIWDGQHSSISPLSESEAKDTYEHLHNHKMEYEEAFGVKPEEA